MPDIFDTLDEPKTDIFDEVSHNTDLSPVEEKVFQRWKEIYAPNDSGQDYDLRGAFKANVLPDEKTGHWPDTFKKPNHPTFSNESQYAEGVPAGHWEGDTFVPPSQKSAATRSFYGLPQTAPSFPATPERTGPDPNDPQAPYFPTAVFQGPGIPRPFEQQSGTGAQILAGLGNAPSDIANFALSGPGVATAGILPTLSPALQRVISAGFAADQAKKALQADTLQEGVSAGIGAGLAGLGAMKAPSELIRLSKDQPKTSEPQVRAQSNVVAQSDIAKDPLAPVQSGGSLGALSVESPLSDESAKYRQLTVAQPETNPSPLQSASEKPETSGIKEAQSESVGLNGQNAINRNAEKQIERDRETMNVRSAAESIYNQSLEKAKGPGSRALAAERDVAHRKVIAQTLTNDPVILKGFDEAHRIASEMAEAELGVHAPVNRPYKWQGNEDLHPLGSLNNEASSPEVVSEKPEPIGITEAIAEIQKRNAPAPKAYNPASVEPVPAAASLSPRVDQPDVLPQESVPTAPRPETTSTGTKNATTALERESRGIPEAEQAARRDFGTVWDEAAAEHAKDPTAPQRLVESLKDKPRALSDKENAMLLRRQIEVQNEHSAAVDALNSSPDNPDAIQRLESARNAVQDVYDAGKAAGTETGRGLNARRMLASNDFTLAKMEAETRAVANQGKPLSEKQAADVKILHQRIANAEAKVAAYEAREQFRAELQVARKTRVTPQTFLETQAQKARERIVARRGRLYATIDPIGVAHLADEAIIGASHIARGVRNFRDWSVEMVKEFGDKIKPHLQALFQKAQTMHSEAARASKLSPDQREANALAGEKKGIVTRTEKLQAKTEAGDFTKAPKKEPRMDHEKSLLLYEYQKAKEAYTQGLLKHKLSQQSMPRKALRYGGEVLNTTRAIMTSFDLSAVLRQGGFIAFGHPLRALKNFPDMFRAFASEKAQFRINQEIKARPNAPQYKQSGLYLSDDSGVSLSRMEEAYMSRWAKKIPIVAGSERAYTTFLNKLRADSFDSMSENLGRKGKVTPEEGKAIANFVNVATGRGNMGGAAQAAVGLNTVFFAPRYVLSRFQALVGQPMYGGTMRTRLAVAKEYARFLGGAALVYALGKSAGAEVESDPRSSDFGKLKFGNTRVDPLAGLAQSTVLASRLSMGETKTGKGKIVPIRGEKVPFGTGNSADVLARFLRTKLSPAFGAGVDLLAGKNVVGQPVTPQSAATQMMVPLSFGDVYSAMKEQGVEQGSALAILAIFGMGVTNYATQQPKGERRQTLDEANKERKLKEMSKYLNSQR